VGDLNRHPAGFTVLLSFGRCPLWSSQHNLPLPWAARRLLFDHLGKSASIETAGQWPAFTLFEAPPLSPFFPLSPLRSFPVVFSCPAIFEKYPLSPAKVFPNTSLDTVIFGRGPPRGGYSFLLMHLTGDPLAILTWLGVPSSSPPLILFTSRRFKDRVTESRSRHAPVCLLRPIYGHSWWNQRPSTSILGSKWMAHLFSIIERFCPLPTSFFLRSLSSRQVFFFSIRRLPVFTGFSTEHPFLLLAAFRRRLGCHPPFWGRTAAASSSWILE